MTSKNNTTLLFFTHSFPFGKQESFIETEIAYLSKNFDEVIIIPFVYGETSEQRSTPPNVQILKPILNETSLFTIFLKGIFNTTHISPFLKELRFKNLPHLFKIFKHTIIARFLASHPDIKKLLNKNNAVSYFYWGVNWSHTLAFMNPKMKTVVRFHRYDLYEEEGFLPFREILYSKIDHPVFISRHGFEYAKQRYYNSHSKFKIFKLGVNKLKKSEFSNDGILRIVSCSNLIPVKRVELLSSAINQIKDIKIEWTHFGDGPNRHLIESNSSLNLKGRVSNREVLSYYENNQVDLFINVSLSEGLPVSIMEATSAAIPVIATDAGGTNELIPKVLPLGINAENLAKEIISFYENYYRDDTYRLQFEILWNKEANADNNYSEFSAFLKSLTLNEC